MLFGGLLLIPAGASASAMPATTTDSVNLRSGPSAEDEVMAIVPGGASISITGDPQGGFYPVVFDGVSGYISADFISFGEASVSGAEGAGDQAVEEGYTQGVEEEAAISSGQEMPVTDEGPVTDGVSDGAPTGTAWVATDFLNFRSEPNDGDNVIEVFPNGTAVELTGQQANGYWQADAAGTTGWLHADFLTTSGDPSAPTPETEAPDPQPGADMPESDPDSGVSDPGPENSDDSGSVAVGDTVTGSATVTVSLNLRTGPGEDYAVQRVMPGGVSVELRGDPQGGYYPLSFNGTTGWAHGDWLNVGGDAAPQPGTDVPEAPRPGSEPGTDVPDNPELGNGSGDDGNDPVSVGDNVTGSAMVTSGLNLRSGPGTDYEVKRVMPEGSSVELRGERQGAFYPLSFNGTTGWAHGDWLAIGGDAAPQPGESTPGSEPDDPTPTPEPDEPAPTPTPAPDEPEDNSSGSVPIGNETTGTLYAKSVSFELYTGPGSNYDVVRRIPPNTQVDVRGEAQNGYVPIWWAGYEGWALRDNFITTSPGPDCGDSEIAQIICDAADRYGQPREDMLRVATCESHLNPNAVNSSSGASGLFQFMPSTWEWTPYADQDIFDAEANANAAAWMWSQGHRDHWACQ